MACFPVLMYADFCALADMGYGRQEQPEQALQHTYSGTPVHQ
jgi:hypothetical protein